MISIQEIIKIYAEHGLDVSETEADADLTHAMSDHPTYECLLTRIRGYAQEQARCDAADGRAAEEHEENYH